MKKMFTVLAVGVAVSASLLGASTAFAKRAQDPPSCYPNCAGQNLTGSYYGASMPDADLSGAHFGAAKFKKANLSGADLTDTTSAYITTSLNGPPVPSWFTGANMSGADLSGAVLIAQWNEVNLSGATAVGADLNNSPMKKAKLIDANFTGANLTKVNLKKSNLSGANLTNANLAGANLKKVNFTGADITGANFTKANFKKTICPDGTKTNKGCS